MMVYYCRVIFVTLLLTTVAVIGQPRERQGDRSLLDRCYQGEYKDCLTVAEDFAPCKPVAVIIADALMKSKDDMPCGALIKAALQTPNTVSCIKNNTVETVQPITLIVEGRYINLPAHLVSFLNCEKKFARLHVKVHKKPVYPGLLNELNQITWRANPLFCIHKDDDHVENGMSVHTWQCEGNDNDQWLYDFRTGQIRVKSNPAFCIHKKNGDVEKGNPIHIWECGTPAHNNEQWEYDNSRGLIRSREDPRKCIHVKDPRAMNGNKLHLWDCIDLHGYNMWGLPATRTNLISGSYQIKRSFSGYPGYCMHKAADEFENGVQIHLWGCLGMANDQWNYNLMTGQISSLANPKFCIHKRHDHVNNSNPIQLWECQDPPVNNEQWMYDGTTGQIRLRHHHNKCIHSRYGGNGNGNPLQLWDCWGSSTDQYGLIWVNN